MRIVRAFSPALAFLAIIAAGNGVHAQDAIPETPPELRDFRLDPERARPQPQQQPTAQPVVVPPPTAVPTLPESAPSRQAPIAEPTSARRAEPTTAAAPPPETTPTVVPDTEPPLEAITPPSKTEADASLSDQTTAIQPSTGLTWWPIAVVASLVIVALMALIFWRRHRRNLLRGTDTRKPVIEDQPVEPILKAAGPAAASPPLVQPVVDKPLVTVGFVPEKATISFTALTVRGQLQLTNEGNVPAKDMQFRAGLISASAQQSQVIKAFHQNAASIAAEPLGEIQPGERIGRAIELSVPLIELQSFPLGDQQLLVPIMIASLTYGDGDVLSKRALVACMIGRETDPPQPKMAPLRLDLGPRSFAPLGQRPVPG